MKGFAVVLASTVVAIGIGVGVLAGVGQSAAAPQETRGCQSSAHLACITWADGGHRAQIRLGELVQVVLDYSGLEWSGIGQIGPQLLRPTAGLTRSPEGISESYVAIRVGQTSLQATGAPRCARGQACPQFVLLWRVHIVVTR